MAEIPIFDGHNDLLSCLQAEGETPERGFFAGREGDITLAKCRAGGFAGGFFAIWPTNDPATRVDPMASLRVFPEITQARAVNDTLAQAALFSRLSRGRPDALRACRTVAEIETAQAEGAIAAVLHLEGAEAIGPDLDLLHLLYAAGLRSLGPVWSRPNIFGHGVPFNFPASPDTGPGLSAAGGDLLRECDRLGILFDLSHLNEAGFWDVTRLSQRPLVATHSAAHALTPATRNLTDKQLDAMAERGGLVGLNFGCAFLRADGVKNPDTAPEILIRHLDHLLDRLGESGVALGSDFDGTMIPNFLQDAAGLPKLVQAMRDAGYGEALIRQICWGNWMNLLARLIG